MHFTWQRWDRVVVRLGLAFDARRYVPVLGSATSSNYVESCWAVDDFETGGFGLRYGCELV